MQLSELNPYFKFQRIIFEYADEFAGPTLGEYSN